MRISLSAPILLIGNLRLGRTGFLWPSHQANGWAQRGGVRRATPSRIHFRVGHTSARIIPHLFSRWIMHDRRRLLHTFSTTTNTNQRRRLFLANPLAQYFGSLATREDSGTEQYPAESQSGGWSMCTCSACI